MPMSKASGMQEALREVVGKEIMVVVISQCEFCCSDTKEYLPIYLGIASHTTAGPTNSISQSTGV